MFRIKGIFLTLACCLTALSLSASNASAEALQQKNQAPGFYRMKLGAFEVTALFDGALNLNARLLKNIEPADMAILLKRMFKGNPEMQTAVNAYLVNTGKHLVLIDAGAGILFGQNLGNMLKNMKLAGYLPSQVDSLLFTHMHADHIGGVVDENGQPVFPNAKVFVSKSESNFWLSKKSEEAAPPAIRPMFERCRNIAAPYMKNGKWNSFEEGDEIIPGLRSVNANGHTPGHTAYSVESNGQKLLIWGDTVHSHAVQFARPDVSIEFDSDGKKAVSSRKKLMEEAATSEIPVAGMHLPFPGIGHIRAEKEGGYAWVPIEYSPYPTEH